MRIPRVRFSVRAMLLTIAVSAAFAHFVAVPTWNYFRVPRETRRVLAKLGMTMALPAGVATPPGLKELLKQIRATSVTGPKDIGIPIYLDPVGLRDAGAAQSAAIAATGERMTIRGHLDRALPPLGLDYFVKDGMLTITSAEIARATLQSQPETTRHP